MVKFWQSCFPTFQRKLKNRTTKPNIWLVKKSRRRLTRCTVLQPSWYSSTNLWGTTIRRLKRSDAPIMPSPVSGLLQGCIHRLCLESNVPHTNFSLHAASDLLVTFPAGSSFGKFGVIRKPPGFFSSGTKNMGDVAPLRIIFSYRSGLQFTLGMFDVDSHGSSNDR